jgi:hypothetical protein
MEGDETLHCPDYCEDVALRKNRDLQIDVGAKDS